MIYYHGRRPSHGTLDRNVTMLADKATSLHDDTVPILPLPLRIGKLSLLGSVDNFLLRAQKLLGVMVSRFLEKASGRDNVLTPFLARSAIARWRDSRSARAQLYYRKVC
jgi:hypothetical protein